MPDRSAISQTQSLIDAEANREMFGWVKALLVDCNLLKSKAVDVNAKRLEAAAAKCSIA